MPVEKEQLSEALAKAMVVKPQHYWPYWVAMCLIGGGVVLAVMSQYIFASMCAIASYSFLQEAIYRCEMFKLNAAMLALWEEQAKDMEDINVLNENIFAIITVMKAKGLLGDGITVQVDGEELDLEEEEN